MKYHRINTMKFTDKKMLTLVILLLDMFSIGFAGTCKTFKPVDDFSIKKFASDWYLGGIKIGNSKDSDKFSDMECTTFNFFVDNDETISHNWTITLITRGKQNVLNGRYTLPDPTKGDLKLYFAPRKLTYDYTVLCTDFETYSVNYACVQITPEETSEYINIFVRDPKKYDDVVAKPEVKKCYEVMSSTKIEESLTKVPFENCSSN